MAMKDILNKVAQGGYDALSDSEYAELKKYPDQKELFNKVAQGGYDALSDSEYNNLKTVSDIKPADNGFSELYNKALQVGYSGLLEDEKNKLDYQYAKSAASKTMSLDEVHARMDANAAVSKKMAEENDTIGQNILDFGKAGYQKARDVISEYVAAPALSFLDERQHYQGTNPDGTAKKRFTDDMSYADRLKQSQEELTAEGKRGEGLVGLASDPLNATFLIPGLGEVAMSEKVAALAKAGAALPKVAKATEVVSKVPGALKVGEYLSQSPVLTESLIRGAAQGVEEAGLGYVSAKLDNTRVGEDAGRSALVGGVAGTTLAPLGVALKGRAVENFPGEEKLSNLQMKGVKNTGLMQLDRGQRAQILEDVGERSTFPTRKDYYNLGKEYISTAGKDYKEADKLFDEALEKSGYPHGAVTISDIKNAMKKAILKESKIGGRLSNKTNPDDIEKYIDEKIKNFSHTASLTPRELHSAFAESLTEPSLSELPKQIVPISDMGSILGELNTDIGGIMSKNPTAQRQMALAAHEGIVEDILGRKVDNTGAGIFSGQLPLTDINGNIIYDAAGNPMLKSYNDFLDPMTRENYKLGSKLLKTIASQNETGPRTRVGIPGLGEVGPHLYTNLKSNYIWPSLEYKLGKTLSDNAGVQRAIGSLLGLSGSSEDENHKKDSKKKK